jgi:predicted GNAT family acetyltransferase
MSEAIRDNAERSRYELDIDGQIVFANYRRDGQTVYIRHVEAPPVLRGSGAAGRLMQGIVDIARRDGFKLVPFCSYAVAWLRRHAETRDVLATR